MINNTFYKSFSLLVLALVVLAHSMRAYPMMERSLDLEATNKLIRDLIKTEYLLEQQQELANNEAGRLVAPNNANHAAAYNEAVSMQKKMPDTNILKGILETLSVFGANSKPMKNNVASKDFFG